MSEKSTGRISDGFLTLEGGVDSGRVASVIGKNQCAWLINGTARGGFVTHRPPFTKLDLDFSGATDVEDAFVSGRFQHLSFYDGNDKPQLILVCGGRFFRILLQRKADDKYLVSEITPKESNKTALFLAPGDPPWITPASPGTATLPVLTTEGMTLGSPIILIDDGTKQYSLTLISVDGPFQITVKNEIAAQDGGTFVSASTVSYSRRLRNNKYRFQGWSVQAEDFWVYQDGRGLPVIYNGSVARKSNVSGGEIPTGTVMTYGQGRIVLASSDGKSFRAGDMVFSDGSTGAVLKFPSYLDEIGDIPAKNFGGPSTSGPITAMQYLVNVGDATGQGPLLVGTTNTIFSIDLPEDLSLWKALTSPIKTIGAIGYGPMGQDSTTLVNGDVFFRSLDGIRSYKLAVSEFGGWGNTPIGNEQDRIVKQDTTAFLTYGSAVVFDNRELRTYSPYLEDRGIVHRGLMVLDFNLISRMGEKLRPAWEGVWNELNILKIVKGIVDGKERCFQAVLNDESEIEIWELGTANDIDSRTPVINWSVEARSLTFESPFDLKRLSGGDISYDRVSGNVSFNLKFRSDQSPDWQDWETWNESATVENCNGQPGVCQTLETLLPQYRRRKRFHDPPDVFDETNGKLQRVGYEFQPLLAITGSCRIKVLRLHAVDEPETGFAERTP